MSACKEVLPLISCRASGPLDREDEALVAAHLEACPACRAQLAQDEALLGELLLPPPSPRLFAAMDRLPDRTAVEWRKTERRRQRVVKFLGIAVAAAAVVAMVLAPAYLRERAFTRARLAAELQAAELAEAAPAQVQPAAWQGADLDAVWEASAVVGGDSGAEVAMADEGTIFDSSTSP